MSSTTPDRPTDARAVDARTTAARPLRRGRPAPAPGPEDERLPLGRTTAYGFQHVLTMYGAIVAVPLIIGLSSGMLAAAVPVPGAARSSSTDGAGSDSVVVSEAKKFMTERSKKKVEELYIEAEKYDDKAQEFVEKAAKTREMAAEMQASLSREAGVVYLKDTITRGSVDTPGEIKRVLPIAKDLDDVQEGELPWEIDVVKTWMEENLTVLRDDQEYALVMKGLTNKAATELKALPRRDASNPQELYFTVVMKKNPLAHEDFFGKRIVDLHQRRYV